MIKCQGSCKRVQEGVKTCNVNYKKYLKDW